MIPFTEQEQMQIFRGCNSATELLQHRELIEDLHPIDKVGMLYYNAKIDFFLMDNVI